MQFKNLSIKTKILSGALSLVLITVIFGILAYTYIGNVSGALFGITQNNAKAVEFATGVERMALSTIMEEKNYVLADTSAYQRAEANVKELNSYLDKVDENAKKYKNDELLKQSEVARKGTAEYANKYREGVKLLEERVKSTVEFAKAGALVGELFSAYIKLLDQGHAAAIKANDIKAIASTNEEVVMANEGIDMANAIRLNANKYMVKRDATVLKNMNEGLEVLIPHYDKMAALTADKEKLGMIDKARKATLLYKEDTSKWVKLDNELNEKVLPAMKTRQ